jgi:hypothetical protein
MNAIARCGSSQMLTGGNSKAGHSHDPYIHWKENTKHTKLSVPEKVFPN